MAQDVHIIGGEFAGHGGLSSGGVMAQAEMEYRSLGPCPVCGAPHHSCAGDTSVVLLSETDPLVRLLVDATGTRLSPGSLDRYDTFVIGLAGAVVRRSLARYGPPGCYEEIDPGVDTRPR